MGRRYLITGGAGFIGSNFIRHLFRVEPHATVVNLDALAHAGVRTTVIELPMPTGVTRSSRVISVTHCSSMA